MALVTVDLIDWSHPLSSWAVPRPWQYPLRLVYKTVQPQPGIDLATVSMRGNHLAYAVTQGISGHSATVYLLGLSMSAYVVNK